MNTNDQHTIYRILQGDKKAMEELYQRHEQHWFRLCLRYGKNRNEAHDILQEGLIMVFQDLKQFDINRGEFKSWSNRVMVNSALRYLKKNQWQQAFEDLEMVESKQDFSESIFEKITAQELTRIIQQLPSGYRVVFNMYEIEGFSHQEIADILNISVGTSKSQLAKAKKLLRQKLEILF